MPSDRRVIAFRPDDKEQDMIDFLHEKNGLPASRNVGVAIREKAEREGYKSDWKEQKHEEKIKERP
ncbi:MAG: hypothetical protein V4671_08685 [Armatimonadota bacterium]